MKLKNIFRNTKISSKNVIVFAILIGIVIGIVNRIPILNNTSFQDIAVVLDMWVILAIFIIVNCEKWQEAVLKCFLFFLISQPLIYFTEIIIDVLFYNANFIDTFILYFKNYYFGAGWLTWTILTIPGSFIAFQIKKNNILASLILAVATSYLAVVGLRGLIECILYHFPYHLLNSLICLFMAYYLIIIIITNKKPRITAIFITFIAMTIGAIILIFENNKPPFISTTISLENNKIVDFTIDDETIANAYLEDDSKTLTVKTSTNVGKTTMTITDEFGKTYTYEIVSTSKNFEVLEK